MLRRNDQKILNAFGNNLKRHRKSKGLSIRQLAAEADMEHSTIFRYEQGKRNPSLTIVHRLAAALEISVVDLVS